MGRSGVAAGGGWQIVPFEVLLPIPLATAQGMATVRRGFLVRLADTGGAEGWGEAAPQPELDGGTLEAMRQTLEAILPALSADISAGRLPLPNDVAELAALSAQLALDAPGVPGPARAAIETALADLAARRAGQPLARWLSPAARSAVLVEAVVGAVGPERAARQAQAAVAQGFRAITIEVGTNDVADLQRVAVIRATVGRRAALRADASGAWDELRAEIMLETLAAHDLEYVEQPVAADDVAALARLRRQAATPVAADEALLVPGGLERVLAAEAADVLVLRPSLAGGIVPTWQAAQMARERGMDVIVASTIETAVGRTAAAHLAAALPGLERACNLGTSGPLTADVAVALGPYRGCIRLSDRPGLGLDVRIPDGRWAPSRPQCGRDPCA